MSSGRACFQLLVQYHLQNGGKKYTFGFFLYISSNTCPTHLTTLMHEKKIWQEKNFFCQGLVIGSGF
jgi:hypothetical protein